MPMGVARQIISTESLFLSTERKFLSRFQVLSRVEKLIKIYLLAIFVANNAKTTNQNSPFQSKTQTLNYQTITLPTLPKAPRSHLEAISKAGRRQSEG